MKYLILGGEGNLGCRLADLLPAGDFLSWDRSDVDLTDFDKLIVKLDEAKPQIIINAAAYNAVDKCENDTDEESKAFKLNAYLPQVLGEWCLDNRATLVQYSSDYVFSGNKDDGYLETDKTDPINVYGKSKALGEKLLAALVEKGLKLFLIRTSKLFGPRGRSEAAKLSFFDIMLKLAREKDELKVVDDELSCFTYTPDLAMATLDLLKNYQPGWYHITNAGAVTWYGAVCKLLDISGQQVKVTAVSSAEFPRPARRPHCSELKNNRGPKLRPWQEALTEYLKTL